MSTPINNGGPAFPCKSYLSPRDIEPSNIPGMSLRDWFAGQAMQGLFASDYKDQRPIAGVVAAAYASADAMLAERAKEAK